MIIGFTGTRQGMSIEQRDTLKAELVRRKPAEFHHGDCVGADAEAHAIALALGISVVIHPPLNNARRAFCKGARAVLPPEDYHARNHAIVNACSFLIATPKEMEAKKKGGTWYTIRYAKDRNVAHLVILRPGWVVELVDGKDIDWSLSHNLGPPPPLPDSGSILT